MASNDKYNKAVERVTGQTPEHAPGTTLATPPMTKGAQAMVLKVSEADIGGLMNDSSLEFAPQALTLEESQMIDGILEGQGPVAEVTDPTTKEMREVDTWVIRSHDGNARVSILTSAQLEKKLPPFVGGPVKIIRGKDLKTSAGRRVTDYLVCGPKLASGKQRSFADPTPKLKALAAGAIDTTAVDAAGNATNHAIANPEQRA